MTSPEGVGAVALAADERYVEEHRRDYRSPAQVDRDRLLYSTAFSRLAEITQVVSADRGHVFHNRLTHSLKVAQLARRIAEGLIARQADLAKQFGVNPDAAEAAALAHDLGHPPFGHIAEEELNKLAVAAGLSDGFEGNAQSFRIVAKLATSDAVAKGGAQIEGLNLTRGSLNGILKYPWRHGENQKKLNKWGAYDPERELFDWARKTYNNKNAPVQFEKSVEAELMDWADDITYAVHDLIDFYCAGKIPLDRLADPDDKERELFLANLFVRRTELSGQADEFRTIFERLMGLLPLSRRYEGTVDQRWNLWQFITILISRYVRAIQLISVEGVPKLVSIEQNAENEILLLKELTWHYVILNDDLATEQRGQRAIVREVLSIMLGSTESREGRVLFPISWRNELERAGTEPLRKRLVVDYVAGMTEREITRCYCLLTGRAVHNGTRA